MEPGRVSADVITASVHSGRTTPMRLSRGTQLPILNPETGARNIDLHVNTLSVGAARGPRHYHAKAENIYLVLEGSIEVETTRHAYTLHEGDLAFIPPGVPHATNNAGQVPAKFIEIYAPPGPDFHLAMDQDANTPEAPPQPAGK